MATLIGTVTKVIGQVFAQAADGTKRALVEGDRLFAGDQLITGAEGAVAVHLQNGKELTLGRGSSMTLSGQLLADQAAHVNAAEAVTPSEAQLTDVEQIQKAIAAGDDPSKTAEATAAGPNAPGGAPGEAGGGHSFVLLTEVGGRVDPIIGFPTAGFGGIPEFPEERHNVVIDNGDDTPVIVPPPVNNLVTLNGLSVPGGELNLNEANLPDGSAANPAALTQSGSFTVNAPDGLTSLSVGGISLVSGGVAVGFPQSITTQLGNTLTITGYNASTGVVTYSYTLNGSDTHAAGDGANNLSEQFTVVAGDSNGDTATGTLDVNITDDVPRAVDDSNASTASETLLTLTGNVLTNDVQGADRVATGPVTPGTFTGTYGTLVLNANGTYTYTLNTSDADFKALHGGGNGTETFAYTLTDSDGDSSTANLVLQIHNNDDPVTLGGLNIAGGELTVFEKSLALGSSPDSAALTQSGSFTVTALDGVTTLTVGGIAVVTNGVAAGFPQSVTTPLGSTLTITGFNAATGVVSYSYTLVDNEAHPNANGANTLPEQFAVTVVDDNGTTGNATLDVNIIDDLPKAVDDSNTGTASETNLSLTGTVLTNDVQGADRVVIGENAGPITAGTFAGTYGTLVLNANGTYTYTLNTSDADFKALHGGGNGTENFTYTITDSDGDTSTANLVLQIHNNDDPVIINGLNVNGGELTVYEKNLSDGSAPDSTQLTQSGTFNITALDGVTTLTVGGIAVVTNGVAAGFPQSITTPLGSTLTITGFNETTGVVSYSYTLVDNEAHPNANGANTLPEQFAVTVVDDNGTTANATLDVNIVDDLPKGVDDSNAGTASETNLSLTGNVLTNDVQGADRVVIGENAGPITAGTFAGTYGTLVLNANGTYTYTLNTTDADFKALHGGGDGTETFTYTITDSDGDTSTANLVLQIHNNDDPVIINGLNVNGGELTVYEKNLSDGSAPDSGALTQSGTFNITALDGVTTLTVGGIAVVTNGVAAGFPQSITTPLGSTLTITGFNETTGVVSYSYTLVDNEAHPTANGANTLPEQFAVTVVDDNGTTANATLDVNIVDDLPKGVDDSNAGTASETNLSLTGNVLINDVQGADRVATGENAGPITAGTFAGTYGTLVLNANGTYTYTLNTTDADFKALHGGGNGTETFTYTITDSDGDTSTANLVLQIHNNDDPVIINGLNVNGGELTVYEKNLSDGSAPDSGALTQSGTFNITALDGVTTLTVGGIAVVTNGVAAGFPQSITTPLGSTLTITGFNETTGVVSYSYTLVDNEAHATANGANNLPEQFAVTVVDDNGTTANATLDVNIVDDLPKALDDSNTTTASESQLTLTGNVLTNDVQGADRVASGPVTAGTFTGTYGTLVLNANGTYTYTLDTTDADFKNLHGGGNGTENFTYTITDSDGDTSTANLVLNIHNNDDPVVLNGLDVNGGELTVYEKNLGDGTDPNTPALTQSGTFTVTALDGLQTLTVGGINVVTGGVAAGFPQSITTPLGSTLTITGYNETTGVVSYSYTLVDNETHPNANGANSITENFNVVATDTDGSTANGQINVNIVDDLPSAHPDAASVAEGGTVSGNVLDNDIGGADGPAATGAVVGVRAGADTSTSALGGLNSNINGTYGYLTLDANGNAVYHSNPNAVNGPGAVDVFTYTVRDSDGDESTTTITIDVANSKLYATSDTDVTVFEKALDLTKDGADLAPGTVTGSDPSNTGETASGTLVGSVTGAVGAISYALVGSATGNYGQIVLNPNGTYTYTLTSPATTTPHADDGANILTESFTYQATDSLGNIVTSTIVVSIVDDVPHAVNDSNANSASESLLTLTGNVLTNDVQGADVVASGPITPGTFTGTYGKLVLNADGSYTYTLDTSDADFKNLHGGGNGTETFTYTLTDADGDVSTANLVLNIHNNDDPVVLNGLDVNGGELTVYEKNLSDGTSPNTPALTQSGTFTVTALDGLQTLTVGGIAVVTNGVAAGFPQSVVSPLGSTFTITNYNPTTGVVSYSYTLVDNETHPNANGANSLTENFNVVATDTDGSTANGQINVNIIDDLPTAKADTGSVAEGGTVNISVLGNDVTGADGAATGGAVVGVRAGSNTGTSAIGGLNSNINGNFGYLTLDAAGNAVYHSNPNSVSPAGATDTFTYTIRDSDGDESTTTITINVADSKLIASVDQDVTVYEKALDLTKDGQDLAAGTVTGSDPTNTGETATGTLVGAVTGGSGALTYTLVGSATGSYGQIQLNADGTYTYTLTSAPKTSPNANDGANSLSESFTYKATDALGNSTTSTIVVNIVDDVPKAVASDRSVAAVEIDSNLLIVLDISGSMADASGVPGLSRLALAKQAISALLDKYDDLGDVKVQLVTFSSSATDRTSVWVDIATAKTILAGLTAGGGTNYDAAVATMQTAFNTSGKLTGAQNVGYFFSDGKPTTGQEIGTADETALKAFLDANNIRNYAIGLGSGVSNANLDPVAYDGITHTNTNAVVVTDLNQLNSVLSGTVVGAPVTGSLLGEGGTFGADGGFIKTIVVDGTTYTYDPKALSGQGSLTATVGTNHGTFNTVNNSVSIATNNGGTLVVNLDTGDYTYTSQKTTAVVITENIGFTVSDNDGDLASSTLTVKVIPNAPPVAADDHVITNVLSSNVVVPGELLLANDTDPNGDTLNATPTTFNTGWISKAADFTGTGAINFTGTNANTAANQNLANVRNSFSANAATMTAVLVVSGYLGAVTNSNANDEDRITVNLRQGETLNLDHNLAAGHVTMEYSINGGAYTTLADGQTLTAAANGTYQIHITNINDTTGSGGNSAENYQLTMTLNYAGAHDITPDFNGTYTANDNHGGSDTANVSISYQDGHTLTGTSGDDILVAGTGNNIINAGDGNDVLTAGSGNNEMHGGAGNDLLYSGPGNDLLDGGTGTDTASYAHATAGVTVNLGLLGAQNTLGAGTDTLTGIENLVGSNFNDTLTGDNNNNVINGGLGNDILNGGGGDDLLIGGLGNNTLTGGAGADTFQYLKGNSGHDTITDFTPGTDKLDLSQLLQGENGTTASLDDYLHFTVTGTGASVLTSIDVSAMAGATPNQTIDLAGVNLASHYGVTPGAGGMIASGHDTATIITGMLNDHSLKVDTV
ncbi:retention module-containing protein [Pseudomonas rustica]|uniref:Retention module-containing protein n=1 Tax=Pseudomonas rustica TaxID=2827099 RepID=A0ABS5N158_9PSED|nr:retention module-containing protein [Pseudomonas rustica]MBS4079547.1 retention module-containing protein [Pseudomonas rustica]